MVNEREPSKVNYAKRPNGGLAPDYQRLVVMPLAVNTSIGCPPYLDTLLCHIIRFS